MGGRAMGGHSNVSGQGGSTEPTIHQPVGIKS